MLEVLERNELLDEAERLSASWNHAAVAGLLSKTPESVLLSEPDLGYRLALAYMYLDERKRALALVKRLRGSNALSNAGSTYRRLLNLHGVLLIAEGLVTKAEPLLQIALESGFWSDDQAVIANATTNLGVIADIRCEWDLAAASFRRSLLSYQVLGDRGAVGLCHHNLGMTYRQLNKLVIANTQFELAAEYLSGNGLERALIATDVERALVHWKSGDLRLARNMARRAILSLRVTESRRLRGEAFKVLGLVEIKSNHLQRAKDILTSALTIARLEVLRLLEAEALEGLAVVAMLNQDVNVARQHYEKAARVYEIAGSKARAARSRNALTLSPLDALRQLA